MKNRLLLSMLFVIACLFTFAQNAQKKILKEPYPENRRWIINFSPGVNFDLFSPGSNPYSTLPGTRRNSVFSFKYKITHLFSDKLGWFADIQMNFYHERPSEYLNEVQSDLITSLIQAFGELFAFGHPSFSAGMLYRIDHGRWRINPEVGLGYGYYLLNRDREKTKTDNGVENSAYYKQRGHSLFMSFGVSANYFISKRCFFVLHANFQQPLQKSGADFIRLKDKVEVENISYKTTNIGKSINLSLGFGFTFGKKRL